MVGIDVVELFVDVFVWIYRLFTISTRASTWLLKSNDNGLTCNFDVESVNGCDI
jgi:hypothetical protein